MIEIILIVTLAGVFFIILKKLPEVEIPETRRPQTISNIINRIHKPLTKRVSEKSFSLLDKADQAFENKNFTVAEKFYLKSATKAPLNGRICGRLGIIYLEKGNFLDAKEAFLEALKRDPENPLWYNNLGLALYNLKRYSESLEAYQKSIKLDNSEGIRFYNLGLAYEALDELDAALDAFERAKATGPKNQDFERAAGRIKKKLKLS